MPTMKFLQLMTMAVPLIKSLRESHLVHSNTTSSMGRVMLKMNCQALRNKRQVNNNPFSVSIFMLLGSHSFYDSLKIIIPFPINMNLTRKSNSNIPLLVRNQRLTIKNTFNKPQRLKLQIRPDDDISSQYSTLTFYHEAFPSATA